MDSPKVPEGLQAFLAHAESLHPSANSKRENGFAKEFQQLKALSSQLKKKPEYSSHYGEMECNRSKNRYKDILPFDHNRVILPKLPGIPGSDYINGSYIKGADGNTAYIAAQGPLPRTVDDFWRLIASHRCQIVIMVCREIEMGKLKCKRYWPESKDEKMSFAGLQISVISEEDIAEGFVIRTILMKSGQDELTVTQLQYTAWPDHDVPKSATPLTEMNRTLRSLQGNGKQNVLIHCSAGCGRTGTICAVDYAWTLLKMQKTSNFSVYDIVADLRKQRMAMVQTKEQYELVYKAVVELVQEEIEQEKSKFHTYVNVPKSPQSPAVESNYENCDFIKSVGRWKQSDMQNGSVPRRQLSLPLEAPAETKTDRKPVSKKPAISPPSPEKSVTTVLSVAKRADPSKRAPIPLPSPEEMSASTNAKGSKDYVNIEIVNSHDQKGKLFSGVTESKPTVSVKPSVPVKPMLYSNGHSPTAGQQKSSTISEYEVLPGPTPVQRPSSVTNIRNKGAVSDYEIPPLAGPADKDQTRHVPEGLLIDFGDDMPPLPCKHHSGESSRYENVQVKPESRSASAPNILDDMVLRGNSLPHPGGAKSDNRGFKTVPNRQKVAPGPKRSPLSADLFEDPGAKVGGGFKVGHSPTDASLLVGAGGTGLSPPNLIQSPIVLTLPSPETLPSETGQHTWPPKKPPRTPIGNYSLVGIPEAGSQIEVFVEPVEAKATAGPSEVKNSGNPMEVKSTGPPNEPSYELVGQKVYPAKKESPPIIHAYTVVDVSNRTKVPHSSPRPRAKVEKEKPTIEGGVSPDREGVHQVLVATDLYATVTPRLLNHRDAKGSNSPNLSAKSTASSSKLHKQSCTSTSSEEGDAPPVPQKTSEAFLAPGEDPYESVQQPNRGTLDRFKKIIKTGTKNSLPKRLSDVTAPHGLPRSNSVGSGVTLRLDDIGFKKHVSHPKGPRSCPKHWPQFNL